MTSPTLPLPHYLHTRPATPTDTPALTRLFFTSFHPSHPFWPTVFPPSARCTAYFTEAFRMGIEDDSTARTFVVEDTRTRGEDGSGKLVGFSRWYAPCWGLEEPRKPGAWPEPLGEWDGEVLGAFFGGMEANRGVLMGGRAHWFLELLGTDPEYQRQGIGAALLKWGSDQADEQDLECYLDASEKGAPFYVKHFGFIPRMDVPLPVKPETYGKFTYISHVRPKKSG